MSLILNSVGNQKSLDFNSTRKELTFSFEKERKIEKAL
jgi:hypothetical protein